MYLGLKRIDIVVDIPLIGFVKRYKKRLSRIGVRVYIPKNYIRKYDYLFIQYARKHNAWILTTDRTLDYDKVIVLPLHFKCQRNLGKPKYEKLWTILCAYINKIRSSNFE